MVVEHRSGVGLKNKLEASRMFAVAARTVHRGGGLRVAISPQLPLEKILKFHIPSVLLAPTGFRPPGRRARAEELQLQHEHCFEALKHQRWRKARSLFSVYFNILFVKCGTIVYFL
jgi:hypothetical protein